LRKKCPLRSASRSSSRTSPARQTTSAPDFVAKSPPDGYSLVIVASSHATNKHLFKTLPYDPEKDFEPVVYTHVVPLLLAVHPSVGAKNVPELIAWIKAKPDKAIYASSGPGSSLHMAAELFMSMSKTKMQHIPYKGSSAAHPDLLSGRTAMIFDTVTAIRSHVKSGAVRGIAVTTLARSSAVPELPTIAESGPAGLRRQHLGRDPRAGRTPKDAVAKLNASINAALKMEDVRSRLTGAGIEIQGGTPEQFAAVIRNEIDKWGRIVKEAGSSRSSARANPCACRRSLHDAEAQLSELFDRGAELVARLEPDLLVLRVARDHALGRAGEEEVARLERHQLGCVAYDLRAVEDHVARVRGLAHFAVYAALDLQVVRVAHQVGGDYVRADRRKAVARLADHPLAERLCRSRAVKSLPVA
jgi:tripartite-type tricarboxylate transporter receptor subunit TctC